MRDLVPNQFDPTLSPAEAMAACGPAAAVAFARANGRNPTIREALEMARTVGWTAGGGMAGPASQRALLEKMGVPSRMEAGVNWAKVQADVQSGNPVIISTPQHYFVASDYDPKTDKFYFGKSGTAFKAGAEWLSPAQVSSLGHGLQAMLFLDNPATPNRPPSLGGPKVMAEPLSEEGDGVQATGQSGATNPNAQQAQADLDRALASVNEIKDSQYRADYISRRQHDAAFRATATKKYGGKADDPDVEGWNLATIAANDELLAEQTRRERLYEQAKDDIKAATGAGTTPTLTPERVLQDDGSTVIYNRNTKTGERTIAIGPDGNPLIIQPKGSTETDAQHAQRIAAAESSAASANLANARAAMLGYRSPSQVGVDVAHQGLYEAQTQKAQLDAIKAAQALIPAQQKAISDAMSTIDYIQTQLASGGLTLDEANQYSSSVQSYLGAALRGSTPEKEAIERNKQITERAQIGRDLLNKKLETTATLTGNLSRDYQTLLTEGAGLMEPPQFNPLRYARALGEELGGGPEMSDLAKALLAAATPQGATPHPELLAVGDNLPLSVGGQDQQQPDHQATDQYDYQPIDETQPEEAVA